MSRLLLDEIMEKFGETFAGAQTYTPEWIKREDARRLKLEAEQRHVDAMCPEPPEGTGLSAHACEPPAQPEDYTQDAMDVELLINALKFYLAHLRDVEAAYLDGGGWCLGRVQGDIARAYKLQSKYAYGFETIMRDCGEVS